MNDKNQPPTARDVLVALLGEAKADEVIEQAARAEYASDRAGEDWDREGSEYRDLYLTPVTAALAAVLPGLLAPEVIAALRAVLEEHRPRMDSVSALYPTPLCSCDQSFPCPTVTAITDALEGR